MTRTVRQRRRALARTILIAGTVVLTIATITEWVGVEWWSSVNLTRLRQRYVIVRSGQLIVGTRGTAGFFNRGIPAPGLRAVWPRRFDGEPWLFRIAPRLFDMNQSRGVSIPMFSPAIVLVLLGGCVRLASCSHHKGHCRECGYDLRGLASAGCPECGTLRDV